MPTSCTHSTLSSPQQARPSPRTSPGLTRLWPPSTTQKEALANASLLFYPTPDAPTCLITDASDMAVGAVLQQHIQGTWHPISFFSHKMTPAETRYSTFDRELLAVYLSIKHFGHFLEARPFHVLTNHKSLTYALNYRSDQHSPRQARHLDYISQFTSTIRHICGMDNVVADSLSRIETNALLTGQPPNVDFAAVGPLPPFQGFTYLLTCVDCYTCWAEAIPLTSSMAEAVAQALLSGWISRFGVPSTIITDHGHQFKSNLLNNLMSLIGSKHARTTAYHPQTNGMVERFHRQLKATLKAQPNPDAWMDTQPLILIGIRTALKEDFNATAAETVYATTLCLPGEFFTPSPTTYLPDPSEFLNHLRTHFRTISPVSPRPTQRTTNIADGLAKATHVFVRHDAVRKPLQPPYDSPYPVITVNPNLPKLSKFHTWSTGSG